MNRSALIAIAFVLSLGTVAAAQAQEFPERYVIGFGGMQPDGPAPLGILLSFNYGGRVSPDLRLGGEVQWYRREYDSTFLLSVPQTGAEATVRSIATTSVFPLMGTADYYMGGDRGVEVFLGVGAGVDLLRTRHAPIALASGSSVPFGTEIGSFSRTAAGLGYVVRAGFSSRPGNSNGAVFVEAFYKGSSIDADSTNTAGKGTDTESRANGLGFRVGFRF